MKAITFAIFVCMTLVAACGERTRDEDSTVLEADETQVSSGEFVVNDWKNVEVRFDGKAAMIDRRATWKAKVVHKYESWRQIVILSVRSTPGLAFTKIPLFGRSTVQLAAERTDLETAGGKLTFVVRDLTSCQMLGIKGCRDFSKPTKADHRIFAPWKTPALLP